MAPGAARAGSAPAGQTAVPVPVTVIVGEEELLVERAVSAAVALALAAGDGDGDGAAGDGVHQVTAAGLTPGELSGLTASW
jgi:hypothetical protein